MDYEDHQKQILRRQNEQISRENAAAETSALFDLIFKTLWFCILYFPFVIISISVGRFAHKQFSFEFFPSAIAAVLSGFAAYLLINWIEAYSDKLKDEGNRFYIPIKILVLCFVSGIPFLIGYQLGASVISGDSPIQKIIAGGLLGLAFAVPAYRQVILSNKVGY